MKFSPTRRQLLKGGLAAAAGLAASGIPRPRSAGAAVGEPLCTVLDISRCIGCEQCVEACREQWQETVPDPVEPMPKPFPSRVPIEDWSKKKDVSDRLTPYNWLYVEHLSLTHKGEEVEVNIPRRCMHCLNPPCVDLCPFGASRVEKNGIVRIDPDICLGGAKCRKVCPWHIPQRQSGLGIYLDIMPSYAGNGVMFKCHRCTPLVAQGKLPRCIEVCPEQIQSIGPRDQQVKKAVALAKQKAKADGAGEERWRDYLYGLFENGGTNTIYVSAIPFHEINRALKADRAQWAQESGIKDPRRAKRAALAGRPLMGPVADTMAEVGNLTWALALAPVAGLAAGLGRLAAGKGGRKGGER